MGETCSTQPQTAGMSLVTWPQPPGARNMSWLSRSGGGSTLRSVGCAIALRRQGLTP